MKERLDHVLSGKADQDKRKLHEGVAAARAKGKPTLKMTDEALGQLADTTVAMRLLHDAKTGEIWFKDSQKRLRYFDGYAVVEAPFTARAIGNEGAAAELDGGDCRSRGAHCRGTPRRRTSAMSCGSAIDC